MCVLPWLNQVSAGSCHNGSGGERDQQKGALHGSSNSAGGGPNKDNSVSDWTLHFALSKMANYGENRSFKNYFWTRPTLLCLYPYELQTMRFAIQLLPPSSTIIRSFKLMIFRDAPITVDVKVGAKKTKPNKQEKPSVPFLSFLKRQNVFKCRFQTMNKMTCQVL